MRADVLGLCYHGVAEEAEGLTVDPSRLEQQIASLLRRGYTSIRASEVAAGSRARRLIVTFDDGYRSVLENALPVLESLDVVATVFVVTDFVGVGVRHRGSSILTDALSWTDLADLAARGWEIGSHTVSHARLPSLGDDSLLTELADSKRLIESELALPCTVLAYPYGMATAREENGARDVGYVAAFTASRRHGPPNAYRCPRVGVFQADTPLVFRAKTSPITRLARRTAVGGGLAGAVSHLRGGVSKA